MTSVFDGMGAILNDVFGAPVGILRAGQRPETVRAVFRVEPMQAVAADGRDVFSAVPTLKVPANLAAPLQRGDLVDPGDGTVYRVLGEVPSPSPAADRFRLYEMEAT